MPPTLDPEITNWLSQAIQAGVAQAERNQALTATVAITCSIAWDPESAAVEVKIQTKEGKGIKRTARIIDGQLRFGFAAIEEWKVA